MSLWPHQSRALDELADAIAAGEKRICLTSPTGGGKTRMMLEHLHRTDETTSVYTDRRMLLTQLSTELSSVEHGIRAAGHEESPGRVQLCMTQTVARRSVKGARMLHPAKQIIWDEVHKQVAGSSLAIREAHGNIVDIGLTATPLGIGHVYDRLIVAGTTSQLRACGALVPAHTYGPDEPDTKWIGSVKIDEGECGIERSKRGQFAKRVFGRVVEHYHNLNPYGRPALLFAPGVAESMWFAEELSKAGIPAAHIDGQNCWLDGESVSSDDDVRAEIAERCESGDIKIVCNRFVLREGINWPFIYHGIFATIFGSITSYIQAGGRILRAHPSLDHVIIQDHGGNWWRHGSLNSDREWDLEHTDRIVAGMREARIRSRKESEPVVCVRCGKCRLGGPVCDACGYQYTQKGRPVLQRDGTLREMKGDIFRQRRVATPSQRLESEWVSRVRAVQRSKKETVKRMTFAQLEVTFARDHNWTYPPRSLPMMPVNDVDWFRPVKDVDALSQ